MPLTPNNREEHWLQGMVDGQTTLEPNERREYWYKEIVDAIGSGGGGGTGGGVLVVGIDIDTMTLDKTWKEIHDAPFAIAKIEVKGETQFCPISIMNSNGVTYSLIMGVPNIQENTLTFISMPFSTDSETGHPVFREK